MLITATLNQNSKKKTCIVSLIEVVYEKSLHDIILSNNPSFKP